MSDPEDTVEDATRMIQEQGFQDFIRNAGIGGVFLAIVYGLISMIQTLGEIPRAIFAALADGLSALLEGTLFGLLDITDAGMATAAASFIDGTAALLGPFAAPVAVGVVILSLYVFTVGWDRYIGFNPIQFFTRGRR